MGNFDGWKRVALGGVVAVAAGLLGSVGTGLVKFSLFEINISLPSVFEKKAPEAAPPSGTRTDVEPALIQSPNPPPAPSNPVTLPTRHGPAFDCSVDTKLSEQEICRDELLSQYDWMIHDLYWQRRREASLEASQRIKSEQIAYLHERSDCAMQPNTHDCILHLMQRRIAELGGSPD